MRAELEVINEEILTHSDAVQKPGGQWEAEARIMGTVKIDGDTYHFEKVVKFLLHPEHD